MEPLAWCRQRLLVPGNPLTASLPFADPSERDAILVLRALISELASAAEGSGERAVAEARLDWWRQALRDGNDHPLTQALEQTGVSRRLAPDRFDALMAAVLESLDKPRFENTPQAWTFFRCIGGEASRLEGELIEGGEAIEVDLAELGAAAYLVRVTRDLAIDARANRWLVPLDLQADFQVSRQDLLSETGSRGLDGLVRGLLDEALRRGDRLTRALPPEFAWRHRHLLLSWALERRLAAHIARRPRTILKKRILPGHAGNVWTAWREARRLKKLV
jgi:15-cis-phytoene synthase